MTGKNDIEDEGSALAKVASGAGLVFGGRILKLGLGFAVQVITARLLGANAYGGFILASMSLGVATLIAKGGLNGGLLRKLPHYEDDVSDARGVVKAGLQIGLVGGVITGTILYLSAPFVATRIFQDRSVTSLIRIAAVGVPLNVLMMIGVSTSRALRDAKPHVIVKQILQKVLNTLFITAFLFAGYNAMGAMAGIILATAISAAVALYLAYRTLPFALRGPTTPMRIELLSFSLPLLLAASASWMLSQTDTILIGVFMTSTDVGVYNIAYRLQDLGMLFFYPITFLLPPVLTRLMKQEKTRSAERTYKITTKWMTLLTFPLFLLLFLFPEVVIKTAFGEAYVGGAIALRILIIPIFVTTFLGANGSALVALGHNRINLYGNGGVAVLNVILNVLLIPQFGITGAAGATATSFVLRDLFYTGLLYYWYRIHSLSWGMIRPIVGAAALIPAGYGVFIWLFNPSFLNVTAVGLLFLTLYGPLVIRLDAIETADIEVFDRFAASTGNDLGVIRRVFNYLT